MADATVRFSVSREELEELEVIAEARSTRVAPMMAHAAKLMVEAGEDWTIVSGTTLPRK